jgi:predicted phosphodiesterase
MKILAIGDIHGRTIWKQIIADNPDADLFIFIGDYLDTHKDISIMKQLNNFNEILDFKKEFPDRVILLIGNHDEHYRNYALANAIQYSGFNDYLSQFVMPIIESAIKDNLIQLVYVADKTIFSHAGLTTTWMMDVGATLDTVNDVLQQQPEMISFRIKHLFGSSPYGYDVWQGPLWVRPYSLFKDIYMRDNYKQVVGHTQIDDIITTGSIIKIDCLENGKYLIIDTEKKEYEKYTVGTVSNNT